ncbi:hypothetical protein Y032_0008g229 [Ancylostoma ceylanicum]|uniref:Uncharacterized protein n=1 Tax=Ancylostoma ceylanicum TaxID=53326 RepID=A0A016VJS9_9BILA|nr:hypothetical protein Y032_0008g229 [Ancylostoma ceylanicum]
MGRLVPIAVRPAPPRTPRPTRPPSSRLASHHPSKEADAPSATRLEHTHTQTFHTGTINGPRRLSLTHYPRTPPSSLAAPQLTYSTAITATTDKRRAMQQQLLIAALFLVTPGLCQTPVIGGNCRLGTGDVQIGGKQTQFFLKCEATSDSAAGEGVWVVKSRAAAAAAPPASATAGGSSGGAVPVENTQPQQHPKLMRKQNAPNICEQDNDAREADACAVSATCLQASQEIPSSYLQCDQTSLRWVRKSCQDGFIFNFEQQTCIVPKRMSSLSLTADATCAMLSASCQDSADCPPTFACKNNCCRLEVCPSRAKVLFTCTNNYQCRAGEHCVFGGCCPQVQKKQKLPKMEPKKSEVTTVSADLMVKGDDDPGNTLETMFTRTEQAQIDSAYSTGSAQPTTTGRTTKMPAAMPIDDCDLDNRVDDCSMSNPCPEDSDCLSGQCCKIKASHCKNGLLPLSVPKFCKFSDDCPIASTCEQNVCCPIAGDSTKDSDVHTDTSVGLPAATTLPPKKRSEGVTKTTEASSTMSRCLMRQGCSIYHGTVCPAGYTCTLDGHCCQVSSSCPDGSVPYAMCSSTVPCPATHLCFTTEENFSLCCTTQHLPRRVPWAVLRYTLDLGNSAVTVYSVPRRTSVITSEDVASRSYEMPTSTSLLKTSAILLFCLFLPFKSYA